MDGLGTGPAKSARSAPEASAASIPSSRTQGGLQDSRLGGVGLRSDAAVVASWMSGPSRNGEFQPGVEGACATSIVAATSGRAAQGDAGEHCEEHELEEQGLRVDHLDGAGRAAVEDGVIVDGHVVEGRRPGAGELLTEAVPVVDHVHARGIDRDDGEAASVLSVREADTG